MALTTARTCTALGLLLGYTLYRVRSLALQPLSAGNSAEFSQADNSKPLQNRAMNIT